MFCFFRLPHALALTLILPAHGIRVEQEARPSTPSWSNTSSEELQLMLLEQLGALKASETRGSRDAESLKALITRVRVAWAEGDASGCFQQLGSMMANLTAACQERNPTEHFVFQFYRPSLPKKTCEESVDDIFVHGRALVEAMQTSKEDLASLTLDASKASTVQALYFLRAWLTPLARTQSSALLWAGFWDADPRNRTTIEKLHEFATATDHATVHPDSWLGQVIDSNDELKDCYKEETRQLLANMWAMASMSFVLSMMENGQGTVVALVNKGMEGERALHKAVLYEHEIPTLGVAAYGLGYWSPQVLVIDLQGTCSKTSPALQLQLASRLGAWATSKQKKHWRLQDFVRRSHLHWRCLDCSETCSLDAALAKQVKQLVEEKQLKDRKGRELLRAVMNKSLNEAELEREEKLHLEMKMVWMLHRNLAKRERYADEQKAEDYFNSLNTHATFLHPHLWSPRSRPLVTPQDLLEENADVNTADRAGGTVLRAAAEAGHAEVAALLLQHHADPNLPDEGGDLPLHRAADHGASAVVALLLEHRAEVNPCNEREEMPLHYAARHGRRQVAALLLEHKAEVDPRDLHGETPLHDAVACTSGHGEVAALLLEYKAAVDCPGRGGATPLHRAAERGHVEVAALLIDHKAGVNVRDQSGDMPLHEASFRGRVEVVALLLDERAEVSPSNDPLIGQTPLCLAAERGHTEVVALLKQHGATLPPWCQPVDGG
ncbi:Ank1 [Symbiodinium natans]|uniref:Ank1 protein n=1 Tax=Symbiodinium natans TaxID=878477 RepID=A0A812P255_9DINO|nr:Ank1 [Symbiodinium natans]